MLRRLLCLIGLWRERQPNPRVRQMSWRCQPPSLVSASRMSLNSWIFASAWENRTVVNNSPATPPTINNQPKNANTFTQSGACGSFSATLNLLISYLRRMELISCANSGPSQTRPTTTIAVDRTSHQNQMSLQISRSALIRSSVYFASSGGGSISPELDSDSRREQMVSGFLRFMEIAGIVFVIVVALCFREFTIGIKKSRVPHSFAVSCE